MEPMSRKKGDTRATTRNPNAFAALDTLAGLPIGTGGQLEATPLKTSVRGQKNTKRG